MTVNIDDRTEMLLSQAVALAQSGKMKSTVHFAQDNLYILNMDKTICVRFASPGSSSFSFFANDYESRRMEVQDGRVTFNSGRGGYQRSKSCPVPKTTAEDVQAAWKRYSPDKSNSFSLGSEVMSLLDEGLSHVEVSRKEGVKLVQRDIYTGAVVEVQIPSSGGLLNTQADGSPFPVFGLRTADLQALFTFRGTLFFYIQPEGRNWVYIEDSGIGMAAVLTTCLYDEMAYLAEAKE